MKCTCCNTCKEELPSFASKKIFKRSDINGFGSFSETAYTQIKATFKDPSLVAYPVAYIVAHKTGQHASVPVVEIRVPA